MNMQKIAVLENGIQVESGTLKVGDYWPTQWGPRKVVRVLVEPVSECVPTEPYGC